MNTIYTLILLSFILCIGFLPNPTGASFEPAKTTLLLGDDNPGNVSLYYFALDHASHQAQQTYSHTDLGVGFAGSERTITLNSAYVPLFHQPMTQANNGQIPLRLINAILSHQLEL